MDQTDQDQLLPTITIIPNKSFKVTPENPKMSSKKEDNIPLVAVKPHKSSYFRTKSCFEEPEVSVMQNFSAFDPYFDNVNVWVMLFTTYQWICNMYWPHFWTHFWLLAVHVKQYIIEKTPYKRFVALIFTLLLIPFETKIVFYLILCQSLKISKAKSSPPALFS